jgi:glutaredoxin 3
MSNVIIYSADWCPYCVRAKNLLTEKQIAFKEINVDKEPGLRETMAKKTGHKTIPMIFVKDEFIGGFSELSALNESGKLDSLLAGG